MGEMTGADEDEASWEQISTAKLRTELVADVLAPNTALSSEALGLLAPNNAQREAAFAAIETLPMAEPAQVRPLEPCCCCCRPCCCCCCCWWWWCC